MNTSFKCTRVDTFRVHVDMPLDIARMHMYDSAPVLTMTVAKTYCTLSLSHTREYSYIQERTCAQVHYAFLHLMDAHDASICEHKAMSSDANLSIMRKSTLRTHKMLWHMMHPSASAKRSNTTRPRAWARKKVQRNNDWCRHAKERWMVCYRSLPHRSLGNLWSLFTVIHLPNACVCTHHYAFEWKMSDGL